LFAGVEIDAVMGVQSILTSCLIRWTDADQPRDAFVSLERGIMIVIRLGPSGKTRETFLRDHYESMDIIAAACP